MIHYLEMGLSFDRFDLDDDLESFVTMIHPKTSSRFLKILSPFDTLSFLSRYKLAKEEFIKTAFKETLYTSVLLGLSVVLSWFFVLKFMPSMVSLMSEFDADMKQITIYALIVRAYLLIIHSFFLLIVVGGIVLSYDDLRIVALLKVSRFLPQLKVFLSYRFSMMMALLLSYGIKTSQLISSMQVASFGLVDRWLAYQVESELEKGVSLHSAFRNEYFDEVFMDCIEMGLNHHNLHEYLEKYNVLATHILEVDVKRFSVVYKTVVFIILAVLLAVFYGMLYLPMQIMEVL